MSKQAAAALLTVVGVVALEGGAAQLGAVWLAVQQISPHVARELGVGLLNEAETLAVHLAAWVRPLDEIWFGLVRMWAKTG